MASCTRRYNTACHTTCHETRARTARLPFGERAQHACARASAHAHTHMGARVRPLSHGSSRHLYDLQCRYEDAMWTIADAPDEDGREVTVTLEKQNDMEWWKCIVVGHEEVALQRDAGAIASAAPLHTHASHSVRPFVSSRRVSVCCPCLRPSNWSPHLLVPHTLCRSTRRRCSLRIPSSPTSTATRARPVHSAQCGALMREESIEHRQ